MIFCKRCEIEFQDEEVFFVETPDFQHAGKLICPVCDNFIKWESKKKAKLRKERKVN
jgi:hypothetical protein